MLRQVHAIEGPSAKAEDKDSFKKWFDGENIPVCKQDAEIYKNAFTGLVREASRRSHSDSHILQQTEYWSKRLEHARRRYLCFSRAKKQGS
jgi:hypothetical protein